MLSKMSYELLWRSILWPEFSVFRFQYCAYRQSFSWHSLEQPKLCKDGLALRIRAAYRFTVFRIEEIDQEKKRPEKHSENIPRYKNMPHSFVHSVFLPATYVQGPSPYKLEINKKLYTLPQVSRDMHLRARNQPK